MEQNPVLETDVQLVKEFCLLWNPNICYHVHKESTTGPFPEPHEFSLDPQILFM
jgi:hypothetical protein